MAVVLTALVLPAPVSAAEDRSIVAMPGGRRISVLEASAPAPRPPFDALYIVAKFHGPIGRQAHASLAAAGFEEIAYLPYDALLLAPAPRHLGRPGAGEPAAGLAPTNLSPTALSQAGSAAPIPGLAAWIPYLPEDRLSQELTAEAIAARPNGGEIPIMVHVMPGRSDAGVQEQLSMRGLQVLAAGRAGDWGRVVTLVPSASAAERARELAAVPDVFFVERIHPLRLLNDRSVGTIQSGLQGSSAAQTPIWNQGIHGEGQVVGEIDTGADADDCWFRDTLKGLPPTNTWSAGGGYGTVVDPSYRKIIAYDFLYSCDQYPGAPGCEFPAVTTQWDTLFHGTHVGGNMCGDDYANPIAHDASDGVAPAAKFVPQDAGYSVDNCGDLPGIGCPVIDTYPIFDQARIQGVRLHNNSYGDNENAGAPNQSNYTARAQDVDRFIWDHPEFLIFHAAGNSGGGSTDFSVGSPATNKNGLAIGSARTSPTSTSDENISSFSSRGWTGDGRIKPDVMAPGCNVSAGNNGSVASQNCAADSGCGTSYASPTAVGAAALARQYFTDGFYPGGARNAANGFAPSAALVKASLINSAVSMVGLDNSMGPISPIPSNEQGWGRIRLDKALLFAPPVRRLYVDDHRIGLGAGATAPFTYTFSAVSGSEPLKVTLVWTDYPSTPDSPPAAPTVGNPASWRPPRLVNDLDLVVSGSSGTFNGNVFSGGVSTAGGAADRRNNVEQVLIPSPSPGTYTISVVPFSIVQAGQQFALIVTGAWASVSDCNPGVPGSLAVTATTIDSVTLDWAQGSPAGSSFEVWRSSGDCIEGPWVLVGTPAAPPFTDSALTPGTTYLYRVSAVSADGLCASRPSACATGHCAAAPVFTGAASAVQDGAATCGVTVTWPAASSVCPGGGLVYNLYRDPNPAFVPGPANLLASCLPGPSYHDTAQLASGSSVTYIVRSEDSRGSGAGACFGGVTDTNTKRVTATPSGPPQVFFSDGFEGGLGNWVATQWGTDAAVKHSGAFSAHSADSVNMCAMLELASGVNLPAGGPRLEYSVRWLTEPRYDGAIVELATGPAFDTWTTLTPVPAYPGTRNTSASACLPTGVACYTGSNSAFVDAGASLTPYAGQAVKFRFRYSTDQSVNQGGIWVDDVSVSLPVACATSVGEVSPTGSPAPLRVARLSGDTLRLTFQKLAGAQSYNLYEGTTLEGSFYSHAGSPGNLCSAAVVDEGSGIMRIDVTPTPGASRYFLVTAAAAGVEGPSGYATAGEIPPADSTCP